MSPKMPAKVFLRFFMVSSPSTAAPLASSSWLGCLAAPADLALLAALAVLFRTELLALLTPLTVLDSEAEKARHLMKFPFKNWLKLQLCTSVNFTGYVLSKLWCSGTLVKWLCYAHFGAINFASFKRQSAAIFSKNATLSKPAKSCFAVKKQHFQKLLRA